MKKLRYLLILLISIAFISCSNKKVVSVKYEEDHTVKVTTYDDGSTKVENVEFLDFKADQSKRQQDHHEHMGNF